MKKPILLCLVFILSTSHWVCAQGPATRNFIAPHGKFTVIQFRENIYKIVYKPSGYSHGESISDAVVLKPLAASLHPFDVKFSGGVISINDHDIVSGTLDTGSYRGFYFPLKPGEEIFGSGERALPLNRRGYQLDLYNNPWYGYGEGADKINFSVPFITSSHGYGLFFDNPSASYLDIGKKNPGVLEYGASSDELNVFVIFGDYQQVLRSYYLLTGTQPLPPRWALGNLMSRFGYTSESQVKEILSKMQLQRIPVDAIIFDLFWFGDSIKHTLGNLDWMNKQAWPHPVKMISDFKKEGIQTILVTEPFFVETSKNYKSSKPFFAVDSNRKPYYLTDFYFGKGGLIDIFRNDARQWFWQFYKRQMMIGVEAWWGDLGEPEKHPADMYHNLSDLGYHRLFRSNEVHNMYGHEWTKMLYRNFAKDFPAKRLFSLNRAGFAGSQRFSIFPWTGDVSRSWSGLRAQLPILLGMSMSGIPYVHSDAGGFAGGEGDRELYVRWLQFAAFTPIFRPHGTALYEKDPQAFSFPSEAALIDTPYRDIARETIQMRYAFLPYNYSLAYQQAKSGKPLMAPLYYYFPTDTQALRIQDEYFWGENMLVAPVLEKGLKTRRLYLPAGEWFSFIDQKYLPGERWYDDSVTLNKIPVFLKEGSFIPTLENPANRNVAHINDDSLLIIYTLSQHPSSFQLYEDDGLTRGNIENKNFELLNFTSSGKVNNQLILSIHSTGSYAGKPQKRAIEFFIANPEGQQPKKVIVNGKLLPATSDILEDHPDRFSYYGHLISFRTIYATKPVTIKIIW